MPPFIKLSNLSIFFTFSFFNLSWVKNKLHKIHTINTTLHTIFLFSILSSINSFNLSNILFTSKESLVCLVNLFSRKNRIRSIKTIHNIINIFYETITISSKFIIKNSIVDNLTYRSLTKTETFNFTRILN